VRWNSAFAHLDEVRPSERLQILGGTTVERLIVEDGRVVMAICADEVGLRIVRADEFVLCAGAYGSPEILLRSGIGPAADLEQAAIDVVLDLPGVGANLHDHPTVEVRFRSTPELVRATASFARDRRAPDEQAIAKASSGVGRSPYDLHLFPYTDLVDGRLDCVIPAGLLAPRSRGRLRLRTQDPAERPYLHHGYLSDADGLDATALRAGYELVRETAAAQALAEFVGDLVADPSTGADHVFAHYWHPAGTCSMGADPSTGAVVDFQGRVHGIGNLRVIDAAVFPTVPRATTHLPVGLLADRLSDDLVGRTFTPTTREALR
jgi:choline dehydrogenase